MISTTVWRLPEVLRQTGLSRSTIYEMINRGHFPPQIQLGRRAGWIADGVLAWIRGKVDSRPRVRNASLSKNARIQFDSIFARYPFKSRNQTCRIWSWVLKTIFTTSGIFVLNVRPIGQLATSVSIVPFAVAVRWSDFVRSVAERAANTGNEPSLTLRTVARHIGSAAVNCPRKTKCDSCGVTDHQFSVPRLT
jgi:prophage regulatory protein